MRRILTAIAILGALAVARPGASEAKSWKPPDLPPIRVTATVDVGRHPVGVAIDPGLGLAVVANRNRMTVSLVSLTGARVGEVQVGLLPTAVAVDSGRHEAVVANAASHTVSVIDLGARAVTRTIRVGGRPVAVAVQPEQRCAVVANEASDTVSIVDLGAGAVTATLPVGRKPSAVAIDPLAGTHGMAAVTSRNDDTVTLLDLGPAPSVRAVVPLTAGEGRARHRPVAVAWDSMSGTIVVANSASRTVSLLYVEDGDRVTDQAVVPVGKLPYAVAVSTGNNFALVTSDQDDVFAFDLETGALIGRADVGRHPRGVAVDAAACRAVVTNTRDSSVSLLAIPCAATLQLVALSPSSAVAGAPDQAVTLAGAGFVPDVTVNFGAAALTPSLVTPTRIVVTVPASLLTVPGTFQVSVTAPSGEGSNSLPFGVATLPPPVLAALTPSSGLATFQAFRLDVTGANFQPDAFIEFNGRRLPTVVDDPTRAHATVPGTLVGQGGVVPVVLVNRRGHVESNALPFTIANPVPALNHVTPASAAAGAVDVPIVLEGTDFALGSRVLFCGATCTQIPSVAFGANPAVQINATIPTALLTTPGTYTIRVENPGPEGGVSNDQPFAVLAVALPPGYSVGVVRTPNGRPERLALLAPGYAVATVGGAFVDLVDLVDRSVVHPFPVPNNRGLLGDLDADRLTGTVAVANANVFAPSVYLLPIDPERPGASVGAAVALPAGSVPFGVAIDPATRRAIVTDLGDNSVRIVDLTTRTLEATIPLPHRLLSPTFLAIDSRTNQALVVDQGDFMTPGAVTIVDLTHRHAAGTVTVGVGPSFIDVDPLTGRAVVSNSELGTVSVIDVAARGVLRELVLGQEPAGVAIDPASNLALVAHQRSNQVTRFSLDDFAVVDTVQLGSGDAETPSDLAWDPANRLGIATSVTRDNLIVIGYPF